VYSLHKELVSEMLCVSSATAISEFRRSSEGVLLGSTDGF